MDRISAIRNVEEALRAFEAGEADLAATEQRVLAALRTYATEFDDGSGLGAYVGRGAEAVEDVVVIASSPAEARERIADHAPEAPSSFGVEQLG
jgi:ABC-type amino acid transport substrate-binding protein